MKTCSICPEPHHAKGYCQLHYGRLRTGFPLHLPKMKGRQFAPWDPARCGTTAQEKAHRRRGERPCEPCLQAQRDSKRRRQLRNNTACINGHEFTPENTDYNSLGRRLCRVCMHRGVRVPLRMPAFLSEMYGEE